MPRCEGLPFGPCPRKVNDDSVVIGKGDLLLCPSCDSERRRQFDEALKTSKRGGSTSRSAKINEKPAEVDNAEVVHTVNVTMHGVLYSTV